MNLLIAYEHPDDPSSLTRTWGPLSALRRAQPELGLQLQPLTLAKGDPRPGWSQLANTDILLLSRPRKSQHIELCKIARDRRIPIWVDADDNLELLPPTHPQYQSDTVEEWTHAQRTCFALADYITCTTPHFAKHIETQCAPGTPVVVIPNAHDDYHLPITPTINTDSKNILWRGGNSHDQDLETILDRPWDFIADQPEYHFHFLGHPPGYVRNLAQDPGINNLTIHDRWLPYRDYLRYLTLIRAKVMIVPWEDTPFNHCKSNLSWLEATATGTAVLAAAHSPQFHQPGITHYDQSSFDEVPAKDFRSKLRELMSTDTTPLVVGSRNSLPRLSRTNQQRHQAIQHLTRPLATIS